MKELLILAAKSVGLFPMVAAFLAVFYFLIELIDLTVKALGFSGTAFQTVTISPQAQTAALAIVFLAGISEMLGQSVALVVNRVPLYRFLASLSFTGIIYALTAMTWGLAVLAVAPLTRVGALGFSDFLPVTGILSLAFAPRLLGVFSIAPYFGSALGKLLEAWSLALAVFGLHIGLGLPMGAAAFCGIVGWVVSFVLRGFLGNALAKPLSRLKVAVYGSAMDKTPRQLVDDIIARLKKETQL